MQYLEDNVHPVLQQFIGKCKVWKNLPLTPVGRVNLIKMSFLPKFLYVFLHSPVPIPVSFFSRLDQTISSFVWAGSTPQVAKIKLQLFLTEGGLSLPIFRKYYWAAQLVTVRWWFTQDVSNPAVNLEAAILGSYSELSNLVYRGPNSDPRVTTPMKTTLMAWKQVTHLLSELNTISPHTLLWGNPSLPHLRSIPDPQVGARFQITKLKQIMSGGRLLPLAELKWQFNLPPWMYFRYVQLRHAIKAQFPDGMVLAVHSVESLLIDHPLSSIYLRLTCKAAGSTTRLFEAWQRDIPALTEEDWTEGLQQCIPLMISARDRFVQLKFIHRVYYTPARLSRIYSEVTDTCPKCRQSVGTFIHMVWECPHIQSFWQEVVADVNAVVGLSLDRDPLLFILGITDNFEY